MKRLACLSILVVMLLASTFGIALAAMDMEDPVLCVAGEWLMVNAAHPDGVTVLLPDGTAYGKSAGCTPPPPAHTYITNVSYHSGQNSMKIAVDGALASTPSVEVLYAGDVISKQNKGNSNLVFQFNLH